MKKKLLFLTISILAACQLWSMDFKNLGPKINTDKDEFLPVVYRDTLYFRRTVNKNPAEFRIFKIACSDLSADFKGVMPIEIYKTKDYENSNPGIDDKASTFPPVTFDPSTPSFYNFSIDKLNQHRLAQPKRIEGGISTTYNDMHPALSPDGSFIVFSSDRPKKAGQTESSPDMDLFITYRQNDNSWSKPTNLGKDINTKENDISPFIAPDGILFYSSKGFIRDSVNIVFSGQAKSSKANKSDIFIIVEKPNYNIIKAEPTGNKSLPFKNPQLLPPPYNTEFNEIGPTVWKDTLIIVASDRLKPYDRPDPLNQEGYDLYGFIEEKTESAPSKYFEFSDSIPFFVTGYYFPNTKRNLAELSAKISSKKLRNSPSSRYIADPDNEYDENKQKIDYSIYTTKIENLLDSAVGFISNWLDYLAKKDKGSIEIRIVGFADQRGMAKEARYVEESISDKDFTFLLNQETPIDNILLSKLRAYQAGMNLKKRISSLPLFNTLKKRIMWTAEGKGVYEGNIKELMKRKVVIVISFVQ